MTPTPASDTHCSASAASCAYAADALERGGVVRGQGRVQASARAPGARSDARDASIRLATEQPRRAARPNGLLEVWAAYRTGEGAEMGEEVAAENGARAAVA